MNWAERFQKHPLVFVTSILIASFSLGFMSTSYNVQPTIP
jgi:hypothetical protein